MYSIAELGKQAPQSHQTITPPSDMRRGIKRLKQVDRNLQMATRMSEPTEGLQTDGEVLMARRLLELTAGSSEMRRGGPSVPQGQQRLVRPDQRGTKVHIDLGNRCPVVHGCVELLRRRAKSKRLAKVTQIGVNHCLPLIARRQALMILVQLIDPPRLADALECGLMIVVPEPLQRFLEK